MKIGRIYISSGFALVVAALYFFDDSGLTSIFFVAAAAHELGHCAAIKLCRGKIRTLRFTCTGIYIEHILATPSYGNAAFVTAAGPFASLLFALLCAWWRSYALAGASIILFLFNMLPVSPLDGGQLLYYMLAEKRELHKCERATRAVSCIVAVLVTAAGVVVFAVSRVNFTLLTAGVWLMAENFGSCCKRMENEV